MPSFSGFGSTSSAPEAKATVKWYNPEKGFGFVEMADGSGDVFLHANSLQNAGFQAVTPGAVLQVRVGQGQKGRQVDQVISVTEGDAPPPRVAVVSAAVSTVRVPPARARRASRRAARPWK